MLSDARGGQNVQGLGVCCTGSCSWGGVQIRERERDRETATEKWKAKKKKNPDKQSGRERTSESPLV